MTSELCVNHVILENMLIWSELVGYNVSLLPNALWAVRFKREDICRKHDTVNLFVYIRVRTLISYFQCDYVLV
jgi:hypothetical protein